MPGGTKLRQNVGWAFATKMGGIPLAGFGALNLMLAGAAKALFRVDLPDNAWLPARSRPRS